MLAERLPKGRERPVRTSHEPGLFLIETRVSLVFPLTRALCNSYPPRGRTRPVLEPDRARTRKFRELLVRYSFLFVFLLFRYSCLVVFVLVHGRVKKTRTRPWAGTGQVRLRARTSTGSARCRRLPEVELAHELELVRGLKVNSWEACNRVVAHCNSFTSIAIV